MAITASTKERSITPTALQVRHIHMSRLYEPLRRPPETLQDRLVGLLVPRLGIDHVDGIGEGTGTRRQPEPPAAHVVLDEPAGEVAGNLIGEQEVEPQRTEVEIDGG